MEPRLAARTLAASTEIANAALSAEDPGEMLPVIVEHAIDLVRADLGLLMTSAEDGTLTVEAAAGELAPGAADPIGIVLSPRSSAARAARGGVPIVVENFTTDPRTAPFVPAELRRYGPFAAAPFGNAVRRLGALTVYRRAGANPFEPAMVDVLTAFAAQAGTVLVLAEGAMARERLAVYQERDRLARELHDVLVQRLYGTGMQLDLVTRRLEGKLEPADSERLAGAVDQLDTAIEEVRATVRALRGAEPLGEHGPDLAESIRTEVAAAGELLDTEPSLEIEGDMATVPVAIADHVRAAAREALSNVVRHSGARQLHVALLIREGVLHLIVRDDGCGIPPGVTERGLRNLVARAKVAGGRCGIRSSPRSGTIVRWQVPLE
ncbi:GAF domain-containing sensor histidine kinase [Sciscionella marina]|uniref:GAF domain-containing sensor histidine kinase n=1 Tax=Sciscionella marina TaxID=508770 RepID=UPI00035D660D|nr:histidine kinase [Sciscionella marina]